MNPKAIAIFAAAALAASSAFAIDLQSARAQGAVGENASGYIEAVKPSAEINALVAEVNARRRAEYTRISKENGQSVEVVGKLAVEQIVNNLPAGALYKDGGVWKKR